MLNCVSFDPQSLHYAFLQTTYDAAENEATIIDVNGAWTPVGDCHIKLGAYDFTNGNHIVIYAIK